MKFAEGKLLKEFDVENNGKKIHIVFRYPKMSDLKDSTVYINRLVEEGALILVIKKIGMKEERAWLKDVIEKMKKKKLIHIVVEANGKFCGGADMRRGRYGSSHVGGIGIALSKEIRGMGIGSRLISFLSDLSRKEMGIEIARIEYLKGNDAAKHLYEKLGFTEAGTIPKVRKLGNVYNDEVQMYKVLK
jgi:RimJ/RimL family protein N-acetyltransferase